jgi:hypothetical protein
MLRHAGIKHAAPATQAGRHFHLSSRYVVVLHQRDIDFYKDIA